jgi:large subunit ribosomal protein L2
MGKNLIHQRRGRGKGLRYKSPSYRYRGSIAYRKYDDIEKKELVLGKIVDVFHCRGHSSPLMEVDYQGERVLISAPEKICVGDAVSSGFNSELKIGNVLPLKNIPEGTFICCVEKNPGEGPSFCRSAGSFARIVGKFEDSVNIKFPSKKVKNLRGDCRALIGIVGGGGKKDKPFVKAGKRYHKMKARNKLYPLTSCVAMNAVDHPFGSGRGRHKGKPTIAPRHAPPGRNVGLIKARRTGKRK